MLNERIKELMARTLDKKFSYTWTAMDYQDIEVFSEQFAKLIVKECAYLVNDQLRTTGYTTHAQMLCKEFGIEFREEDYYGVE